MRPYAPSRWLADFSSMFRQDPWLGDCSLMFGWVNERRISEIGIVYGALKCQKWRWESLSGCTLKKGGIVGAHRWIPTMPIRPVCLSRRLLGRVLRSTPPGASDIQPRRLDLLRVRRQILPRQKQLPDLQASETWL